MKRQLKKFEKLIKDFVYGLTTYEYTIELTHKMFQNECILEAVVFGDRYGFLTSNYYRLKLLPYWMKKLNQIDKEILREKDILEKV
jgi:hypothetical protein